MADMHIKDWGLVDYPPLYAAMQDFTAKRSADTPDELWLCQHPSVYTQGLAGRPEHVLQTSAIPIVPTNRGGQITYHGPGQIVAYPLLDLQRRGYFVKEYVYKLEESLIRTLAAFGITGHRVRGAPGVYVRRTDPCGHERLSEVENSILNPDLGKIAALGIKVSRHCTYHGLALNVAMDLQPFAHINPCGYAGLATVDMQSCGVQADLAAVQSELAAQLQRWLA